jgi:hypothetical protein
MVEVFLDELVFPVRALGFEIDDAGRFFTNILEAR